MSEIDEMFSGFKEYAELKSFAEAQYKTIIDLSKKIQNLENENIHLKKLLEGTVPVIGEIKTEDGQILTSDEEAICVKQLSLLRDLSTVRELTSDEARKVEIYVKTLKLIRSKAIKTDEGEKLDTKDTAELLRLVKTDE